ncbi:MAG: phosphate acyltransferase PlsX [Oscillospiraceae bacterium]|nr:phosphate acyltransferase PlsX [Oscillospiraceae bacterium]
MKIIVDAFGGDNSPGAVISGAYMAAKEFGDIILVGDEDKIREYAKNNSIAIDDVNIEIIDAKPVIEIEDDPQMILREKMDCSMAVGLRTLSEGDGDAFVSAGSTGALVVGATFIAKRLKGIKRAALSPIMPTDTGPLILTDAGANLDCRPEMLVQFGIMASCYMQRVMGIESPRVGLLNVGSESTKGRSLDMDAYKLLQKAPVNFCGNVEARELPWGVCDVVVTDGFTGNIALKLYEGLGGYFSNSLKGMFSGFPGAVAAASIMPRIKAFRNKMNTTDIGGAMLMGISKPVIKAHGNSDDKSFYRTICQARDCVEGNFIEEISNALKEV